MTLLTLHNRWALGDTVCLSALVRDLAMTYPGKYRVQVTGHFSSFWENNPYAHHAAGEGRQGKVIRLGYKDGITAAGRGSKIHFLSWFHRDFERKTGIKVPVRLPYGDIHLSASDHFKHFVKGRYWVIVAGGKNDMPAKVWYAHRHQEVVDKLLAQGIQCVQAGARMKGQWQPTLQRCHDAVGKTNSIRHFFSLISRAEGVICGVTGAMHIAAAFQKPCVVIAGGREEPWWEGYYNARPSNFGPHCADVKVPHKFLHTVGILDCGCGNLKKGCWKDKVVADAEMRADPNFRRKLCLKVIRREAEPMPECLARITSDHVVEAVMEYYADGIIPPIKDPKKTFPTLTSTPTGPNPLKELWDASVASATPPPEPFVRGVTSNVNVVDQACEEAHIAEVRRFFAPRNPKILDHPDIGGKFTICVLGFGDHLKLLKRCLTSVLENTPKERLDLRVALNQASLDMKDYVHGLTSQGFPMAIYEDDGKRRKYPAMRAMFWDKDRPIETKYVLWFDDDSHVVDPDWLRLLGECIVANHPQGARLYGTRFEHDLMRYRRQGFKPEKWFKAASWWKGRNLYLTGNREAPNGSKIVFVSGGFWALATETMRAADIPDVRLNHNGGDCTIGEQVHQVGARIKDFGRGKKPVCWSDAKRRGYSEDFPWAKQT